MEQDDTGVDIDKQFSELMEQGEAGTISERYVRMNARLHERFEALQQEYALTLSIVLVMAFGLALCIFLAGRHPIPTYYIYSAIMMLGACFAGVRLFTLLNSKPKRRIHEV